MRSFYCTQLVLLIIFIIDLKIINCNVTITSFQPETNYKLKERTVSTINANFSTNSTEIEKIHRFIVVAKDPRIAKLTNNSTEDGRCNNCYNALDNTLQFQIEGVFVGFTEFEIYSVDEDYNPDEHVLPDKSIEIYRVGVLRTDTFSTLSVIFTYTMTVLVIINTFVMGLQLDWKVIIQVLRRPVAPLIGFCCQFLIMPLLAFGWASLLLQGMPRLQFGFFAVGCAPGGGASNFWTLLLGGNLDLSVTMTFCSNMAALAMMPLWLFTLGQVFFADLGKEIKIPFENIFMSLAFLIIPCFLGIIIKHFKPNIAEKSQKVIKFTTLIVIGVAIVFGTVANIYVYSLITWKTVLCGMLLPWCGFVISYIVGVLLRQNSVNSRTIAIETGIQNANIAIVLLNFSLDKPDSDLTLVMPVCVLLFTPIPLILALICKSVYERVKKAKEAKIKKDQQETYSKPNVNMSEEVTIQVDGNVSKSYANPTIVRMNDRKKDTFDTDK